MESTLLDIGPATEAPALPAIEAVGISKRYRPGEPPGLVPIPWFFRRRSRAAGAGLAGADAFDDDFDDDDLDDDVADEPIVSERDVWALRDVSFALPPGRVLGVVGENGAGKSTLIRVLSAITAPTEGRAVTRGRVAPTLAVAAAFLDAPKSGEQCIFQTARFCGIPRSVAAAAVEPIREFTELGDALALRVRTYSSGQQQRLAYAISLFLDPDILLSDGALAVGDRAFRARCIEALGARVERGLTVVVSTHDTKLLHGFCTDALWLREGRVEAFGPADEVATAYEGGRTSALRTRMEEVVDEPARDVAGRAPEPRRERPRPAGPLAMTSAGIHDPEGRPLELLRTADGALLQLGFEVREAPKSLRFVITLAETGGTRVRIAQPELFEASDPGIYVASVHLPGGVLPSGSYKAQAAIIEFAGQDRTTLARRTFRFEALAEGDEPVAADSGDLVRHLPWDVALVAGPGG